MKKLLLLLTIFPFLTFGQVKKMYREALRTSNLKERISILNEAIKLEPQYYDAIFQRGLAKNNLGDYRGLLQTILELLLISKMPIHFLTGGMQNIVCKILVGLKPIMQKLIFLMMILLMHFTV